MTADENHETCLLVSHETTQYGNDKPTLRFTVRPVRVTADGTIRNFTDTFGGQPLADLTITAQLDHVAADPHPYGWRTEYRQPYAVDLRRAQTMVKVLRKIDRGLERMRAELGHPESFTAHLARVARVLGATQFCWATERRGWSYDDNQHRFADADEMTYHVHRICRDFAKAHIDARDGRTGRGGGPRAQSRAWRSACMIAPTLSVTAAQIVRQLTAQLAPRTPRRLLIDGARPAWVRIVLLTRWRSMEVAYDLRRDLYDVAVHDLPAHARADGNTRHVTGVYCDYLGERDYLGELLASPPPGATRPLFEPCQLRPTVSDRPEARR